MVCYNNTIMNMIVLLLFELYSAIVIICCNTRLIIGALIGCWLVFIPNSLMPEKIFERTDMRTLDTNFEWIDVHLLSWTPGSTLNCTVNCIEGFWVNVDAYLSIIPPNIIDSMKTYGHHSTFMMKWDGYWRIRVRKLDGYHTKASLYWNATLKQKVNLPSPGIDHVIGIIATLAIFATLIGGPILCVQGIRYLFSKEARLKWVQYNRKELLRKQAELAKNQRDVNRRIKKCDKSISYLSDISEDEEKE